MFKVSSFKFQEKGITLIEIVVVIVIITIFTTILIVNFPNMQRQFALSRVAYKLAQDLRRAQDFGLSGVLTTDGAGNDITVAGYGVYVNPNQSATTTQYIIYADVPDGDPTHDQTYNGCQNYQSCLCGSETAPASDCVVEIIDISKDNPSLYIKRVDNIENTSIGTSINFSPPNPTTTVSNICLSCADYTRVGIVLGLTSGSSSTRTVWVSTTGLVSVQ